VASPTIFASIATNPGSTGSTITVTLSTHAVGDLLRIYISNTGNVLWTGNPVGWVRIQQLQVGTATTGLVGTWFEHKVVSGDSLPLTSPVFTLGATVSRIAHCRTIRSADLEGVSTLPEWAARGFITGSANPVRPPSVTTLAPEMLVLHDYGSRSATNGPDPSGYIQDQETVISGTLVQNSCSQTIANQNTLLSNQDASPTSGVRWVAGIFCIPSPDYVYFRSSSQALTASGTSATAALPSGTSASDSRGNKDLVVVTAETAGDSPSPQVPSDWTEILAFNSTTSGGATTVRKWRALYNGSLNLQFNRSTTGEIAVYVTTYRNTHQSAPIGNVSIQQNVSATTSTWSSLLRSTSKSTMSVTCVADGTPTYTSPAGWVERMDGNGITCADQAFNPVASAPSDTFTLSVASPTLIGLVELISLAGVRPSPPYTVGHYKGVRVGDGMGTNERVK